MNIYTWEIASFDVWHTDFETNAIWPQRKKDLLHEKKK
jgi:hypothetical protein